MYRNVDQFYTHTHTHMSLDQYWGQEYHIEGWGCQGCLRQAMTLPRAGRVDLLCPQHPRGRDGGAENGEWLLGFEGQPTLTICFLTITSSVSLRLDGPGPFLQNTARDSPPLPVLGMLKVLQGAEST